MKPQDIVFLLAFAILIWKRRTDWMVIVGILCLVVSMPLFATWIFFTAQRLVVYAFVLFITAVIIMLVSQNGKQKK